MPNKHLICISSAICTVNTPLDYTETRSFFTHTQRYEQSLQTIEKIREKIPNAYIVFMEGTKIDTSMIEVIKAKADYFFDASSLKWVEDNVNSPYKSMGEISTLVAYLLSNHFNEHKNNFISLSKISGRYLPNASFQLNIIPKKIIAKVSFNPQYHSVEYMSTLFYTVPVDMFDGFIQACINCYNNEETRNGKPIDCILLNNLKKIHLDIYNTNLLNVEGEYGPWGGYVCH